MKKLLGLVVVSLCSFSSFSQQNEADPGKDQRLLKNDISTNITALFMRPGYNNFYGRTYLQYRREIRTDWFAKIDVSTRNLYGSGYIGGMTQVSDTTRFWQQSYISHGQKTIRLGVERNVYRGIFTLGANIIGGIRKSGGWFIEQMETYDSTYDYWVPTCNNSIQGYDENCAEGTIQHRYFLFGASLNLNINMKISRHWQMALVYEPQYIRNYDQGEKVVIVHGDPILPYYNPDRRYSYNTLTHNIDLLVRFRF